MESDDQKEVFTFFGLASYLGQVFEQEVILFSAVFQLAARSSKALGADEFLERLDRQTLGQVLADAAVRKRIPADVESLVEQARAERNQLVHGYFQRHTEDFLSPHGRRRMIEGLRQAARTFQIADAALVETRRPITLALGLTDDLVEAEYSAMLDRNKAPS